MLMRGVTSFGTRLMRASVSIVLAVLAGGVALALAGGVFVSTAAGQSPSQAQGTAQADGQTARQVGATGKPLLTVERVAQKDGFLTVTFTAQNMFSERIVETLGRGLPATLDYEIQLWKKRSIWFDKLVAINRLSYRVTYDPWDDGYRIETREGSSPAIFELEQIQRSLCLHVTGRVADMSFLAPNSPHYVAVRATLKLVSPEDISEVETWLSEGNENGRGGITAIPGYLFDLIVGLSGFGDQAANGRSSFFRIDAGRLVVQK